MIRDLILSHKSPGDSLQFSWDPETGALSGRDTDRVRKLLLRADGQALLPGRPPLSAPDPLRIPASFAVIFHAYGYQLPADLEALIPELADDIPEDAVA